MYSFRFWSERSLFNAPHPLLSRLRFSSFFLSLSLFLSSLPPCLATFGIQIGWEKEAPFHDYQRGGAGGAREQRQRPSRQINLRRDLRSRTSLSAYVYARAPAGLACACRPYRSGGLSSIATKVSEGASDLTMRRGAWTSCYRYYPGFIFHVGLEGWEIMATFIIRTDFVDGWLRRKNSILRSKLIGSRSNVKRICMTSAEIMRDL